MAKTRSEPPEKSPSEDAGEELERKFQEYHRQGGATSGHPVARNLEGSIGATAISRNDELKRSRPRSKPGH